MALESKEEYLIPPELQEEWESYNDACMSLDVIPNKRRFSRFFTFSMISEVKRERVFLSSTSVSIIIFFFLLVIFYQ